MAKSAAFSPDFVRRLTPDARLSLWQAAATLQASPGRFAKPARIRTYRELCAAKPPGFSMPTEPAPDISTGLLAIFAAMKPNQDYYAKLRAAWERMQADTVAGIRSGEVLALGFVVPRHVADAPALIPSDVWGGRIDWDGCKVSGSGLEFVSVRLIEPKAVDELLLPTGGDRSEPRPVGRPSVKSEVFAAYEALKAAGKVDFEAPMKRLYPEIRAYLCEAYPDRAGVFQDLSDETIRQVVSGSFKADRASKKQ
ncbi:MAG: hypothetical protein GEU89_03395 [Kiloniellaceae bacterium]|nr:hypothetical protein [Kiloniellaceae bacterium]